MKVLLLLLILATATKVNAFEWSLHRSLTARALAPLGFSGSAIDEIADANVSIDRHESNNPASHADNEAFEATSALLKSRLQITATAILNGDVNKARSTFGYIAHAVQDFYAHTNYVESMPGTPVDLLNLTNPLKTVTCSKSQRTNGLTSGYYPDASTPRGKCSHSTLNKDSADTSAGAMAAEYGKNATAQMFAILVNEVMSKTNDQYQAVKLISSFKGEDRVPNLKNYDEVANVSFNETLRLTTLVGLAHLSADDVNSDPAFSAGKRVEARINETFLTGLGLTYRSHTVNSSYDFTRYGLDLFSKLYLLPESRFQPYIGAGLEYFKNTFEHEDSTQVQSKRIASNSFNGEILGGMDLMFTRKYGVNLEIKYSRPLIKSSEYYNFAENLNDRLSNKLADSSTILMSLGLIISF